MNETTLATILFITAIILVAIALAASIKSCLSRTDNLFAIAQLYIGAIVIVLIISLIVHGNPIRYSEVDNESAITAIQTLGDSYKVQLASGEWVTTKNAIYGTENKYISNCTIECKTILGFSVYRYGSLVVIKPDVECFDSMSKSEQQSILDDYNDWRSRL